MSVSAPFMNDLEGQMACRAGYMEGCVCRFELRQAKGGNYPSRIEKAGCPVHDFAGEIVEEPVRDINDDVGPTSLKELTGSCVTSPIDEITSLLVERQITHGSFNRNASTAQSIKAAITAAPNWSELTDVQREALDQIASKIARIMNGSMGEVDHWLDIAGYARLAAGELEDRDG